MHSTEKFSFSAYMILIPGLTQIYSKWCVCGLSWVLRVGLISWDTEYSRDMLGMGMCPVCSSVLDIDSSRQGTESACTCCYAGLFTLRIWFSVFSLTSCQTVKNQSGFHVFSSTVDSSCNSRLPEWCTMFCLNFFLICSPLFIIYYLWASLSSLSLLSFPLYTTVNWVHRCLGKNTGHLLLPESWHLILTEGWKWMFQVEVIST